MILDSILQAELIRKYKNPGRKLILLDYDGTLVRYKPKPEQALPSNLLLNILKRLSNEQETDLIIISGRDHADIDGLLGDLPIDIIACHGAIKKVQGTWEMQVSDATSWKDIIRPLMDVMSQQCKDAFVEDKHFSLAWHYRKIEHNAGYLCSRQLIRQLNEIADGLGLKILDGNMVIEVMNREIGKGRAVEKLLADKNYDLIISIGDDVTDEEIFALLVPVNKAVTIKVGNGETYAKYYFSSVDEVVMFLKLLSE